MSKQKLQPKGMSNGYCVRTLNVLGQEYKELEKDDLEQRKAALKARLQNK